jgi:hypothetical protein
VSAPQDWTERGRELGANLNALHTIVVVGSDPVATAEVALGIGRLQAKRRRVAVGDLLGDAAPLVSLVAEENPHGLVDSFLFGVSLNRIAYQVPDAGELFIMPSGTAPIDYEELLTNPRWRRLAAGFREVGALLLLVVHADAAGLADLIEVTDGAVVVGDVAPPVLSVSQTIAWLRPKRGGTKPVAAPLAVVDATRVKAPRNRIKVAAAIAGLALTLAGLSVVVWMVMRPFSRDHKPAQVAATAGAAPRATGGALDTAALAQGDSLRADSVRADSVRRDSLAMAAGSAPTAVDSFPVLPAANRADSARASAWAVRLEQTNTKSGAILDLRGRFETVPAGTYAVDLRSRFFLLVAGAYPTRAGAESLLVRLRTQKVLASGIGSVTPLPLAFLVQADVPAADVPSRLARFAARGQPVYALRQTNGAANLYFGAYESSQHAALAVPTVREAGLTPTLVYRIGRVF